MSSTKHQEVSARPSPPSIEGILADLKETSLDDVAFCSPAYFGFPEGTRDLANTDLNQENKQSSSSSGKMGLDESQKQKQEETWNKAVEFLSAHKGLVSSQETLKKHEQDIANKINQLQNEADQLKDSWESEDLETTSLR